MPNDNYHPKKIVNFFKSPCLILVWSKTKRGKEILLRDGTVFKVIERRKSVPCLNWATGLLIEPPNKNYRWIKEVNDVDFEWRIQKNHETIT